MRQHAGMAFLLVTTLVAPLLASTALVRAAATLGETKPVVDLNGPAVGTGYSATYTEDEGQEPVVDLENLSVSDGNNGNIAWARATLLARPDGDAEALGAEAGVSGLSVKYNPDTGILSIKGNAPSVTYEQVLRTLNYENTSQDPDLSDRLIEVLIHNGIEGSDTVTSTVAINSVNDAPILDNSGAMTLKSILEDETNSSGNTVESIVASAGGDRITDVDGIAEGIAVVEVGNSNGAWQYSVNGGVNWNGFAGVTNNAAVLLNPAARIRFVPNPGYTGSASIVLRAWDQTSGASGDTGIDVSQNGGTTPYSQATETAQIDVEATQQPPIVDLNGAGAGTDFAASFLKGGAPVVIAAADAAVSDGDDAVLQTVTITLTNRPNGSAELLAASPLTTSVTIFPYNPATGLLKLQGPESATNFSLVLRTVTYLNTAAMLNLQDRLVQVSAGDGTGTGPPATTTITLFNENQAPVLDPPGPLMLNDVAEDTLDPAGQTIASVLASAGGDSITDSDPDALEGIAVVGLNTSNGVWQFAPTGPGGEWQAFGAVSEGAAVLLAEGAGIRFVPAADFAGAAGGLTFRAWDQTAGANGQSGVDTTSNGGSSAFSAAMTTASQIVTPVNDPPELTFAPLEPLYVEGSAPIALFDNSLQVSDVDSSQLASASVRLISPPDGGAEALSASAGGSGLQIAFEDGVLTLTGAATPGVYATVLRSVRYQHLSQDPTPGLRNLQIVVSDGQDSAAPSPLSLEVQAVNDPPMVDLNGALPGINYAADYFIKWGPVAIGDHNLTLSDADHTTLQSITVTLADAPDGPAEFLDADVSAAINISKRYDPQTGVLNLTGQDSLTSYQAVLRSVTYNNILPEPNQADRSISVVANDGGSAGPAATSIIRFNPTPTATIFMPMMAQRSEEPNDACAESFWLATNRTVSLRPDDVNDWFYFDTTITATITVELRSFNPAAGQLIVATGRDCETLKLVGSNGDDRQDKDVNLGRRAPGRFYVWVINDGPILQTPYTLRARVTP